ncbi:MAG: DNA-binding protein HU [Tenericutes bacterium ADurb.Bin087]|jgi:DNA-binding protein HU-beta|nr:MAG: DNA-binding protein HU [Tenericutes bacterium ADurb.Bin087]TAH57611.1 MAG: HU family DNA-binding protein [Bacillota bacterium]HOA11084.1 HU family DNA-binding protein [Bacilli bacterium]HOH95233.1 HU family DNA-binding protein [Bacilli bacterium]HPY78815.1 HU family DNA-binding protein [Bacilli bacterium]
MNKAEIIAAIADELMITKRSVEEIINLFCDTVIETLAKGEDVKLTGFGTFQTRERKERRGVSPQTGTEIVIPSGRTIVFKPSKLLKEKVQ